MEMPFLLVVARTYLVDNAAAFADLPVEMGGRKERDGARNRWP